jgi:TonB family protein
MRKSRPARAAGTSASNGHFDAIGVRWERMEPSILPATGTPSYPPGVNRLFAWCLVPAALAASSAFVGCARTEKPPDTSPEPVVRVEADTSRFLRLKVEPPGAVRVWMQSVAVAPAEEIEAALPAADPAPPPVDTLAPPAAEAEPLLKAPILIAPARVDLPASRGRGAPAGAVELEVKVSEEGEVTDVRWAGGSADTTLIATATASARAMRFYPALLGGEPVSVWCRQRFEFPGR